ncbi:hypothetical protein D9M70_272210 [compost metagenome]
MPNIEQQRQRLAPPCQRPALQASGNPGGSQRCVQALALPRQVQKGKRLQCQRGVLHGQVEQLQVVQFELPALPITTIPVPALFGDGQIVIATTQVEWRRQRCHLIQQRLGRIKVTAQSRPALTQDAGFLEGDGIAAIPQPFGMIEADAGDQCQIGVDQVDRIQPPTEPDLENRSIQTGTLEQPESRQGAHLEIGQGNLAACRLDCSECLTELIIAGFDAIDSDSLVVAQQVGRAVDPDSKPLLTQ